MYHKRNSCGVNRQVIATHGPNKGGTVILVTMMNYKKLCRWTSIHGLSCGMDLKCKNTPYYVPI